MTARRPSDLEVEQWRLGELPAAQAQRVAAALEELDDPRRHPTDAEDAVLFERLPPAEFAEEVTRRAELANRRDAARADAELERRRRLEWLWAPVAVAAVILLGFLIWRGGMGRAGDPDRGESGGVNGRPVVAVRDPVDREPTRIKGLAPRLIVRVKDGAELRPLQDGDVAHHGDVLQLSYVAAGMAHGAIVSIDGAGVVTVHLPGEGSSDTRIQQRKETPLPYSYELDDAPGFERFYFVTSPRPLSRREVVAAAESLAASGMASERERLPLDDEGLVQVSVRLDKEAAQR